MQLESIGLSEDYQSKTNATPLNDQPISVEPSIFRQSKISRKRTLTQGNQNIYKKQQNSICSDQSEQDVDKPVDVDAVFVED